MKLLVLAMCLSSAALSVACSSLGVEPWQRDVLARRDMQPGGSRLDDAFDDHMYFSIVASSGGRSFGGGGCGCN
jgi:hypothetical protein